MNPEKKSTTNIYTYKINLKREQIAEFLNQLEDMRQDYLEQAVTASGYRDARAVIEHIKAL
jgi:hypothetical protein